MENRKVMDMKYGSWKQTWVKGEQGLEFRYSVARSITFCHDANTMLNNILCYNIKWCIY